MCIRDRYFTRATKWSSLTSAPPTGDVGPPYNFLSRGSKIGLNFSISAPITLAVVGIAPWNFPTWWALTWAWSLMYKFLGFCTPEIWEGQKVENSARFLTTFDFDREYCRNRSRYQKSGTNLIDNYSCEVQQKNLVNFGPQTKKLHVWMLTHFKSTMRVLCTLMYFTSGHVTLKPGKFYPPWINPLFGRRVLGGFRLGFAPNF